MAMTAEATSPAEGAARIAGFPNQLAAEAMLASSDSAH